ncbi:MAG: RIP metalloprotease RseP, partial [Bacteroidia bacterium]|nr:RIP metalloprotease RseP [Bacteroidia bacterium]
GHYIAARSFGIRVEKFYIFFDAWGIKLFKKKINDTEWGIGWLPLGGYVKISGMIDESLDKDQLESEPEDHEFRSKPAWQRLIVMIGGVTVNFILGILIFALSLWYFGDTWLPTNVANENGIAPTELGEKAGFQEGDKLIALNGKEIVKFRDFSNPDLFVSDNGPIEYKVERAGVDEIISLDEEVKTAFLESKGTGLFNTRAKVFIGALEKNAKKSGFKALDQIVAVNGKSTPFYGDMAEELGSKKGEEVVVTVIRDNDSVNITHTLDTAGRIGFRVDAKYEFKDKLEVTKYGFFESFPEGTRRGVNTLVLNIKAFGQMFKGKLNPVKTVSGPFQIAAIYGSTWNWHRFWQITGMLSFVLAFMNILPIPALDGGHVLFLLIEIVRGKPLPEKVMYYFQIIGMIILFALMAFILFVDGFNTLFK